ncbi:MAG: LapA family protein [Alphaproteobacteria bacterium]
MAVWFVVFSAHNHDAVALSLFPLPYEIALPEFLFALLCFVAGVVISAIAMGLKHSHDQAQFKKANKKTAALEEELQLTRIKETTLPSTQSPIK